MSGIFVNESTFLNRLGAGQKISLFFSKEHFFTLLPGSELINHTLQVREIVLETPDGQQFRHVPEDDLSLPPGSVYSLEPRRADEDDGIYLALFPSDEDREIRHRVEFPEPVEKRIDTRGVDYCREAEVAVNKLFNVVDYFDTQKVFPRAALNSMILGQPTRPVASAAHSTPSVGIMSAMAAPKSGDSGLDKLADLLKNDSDPPDQQVANDRAPGSPATTVKPTPADNQNDRQDQISKYEGASLVLSILALFKNIARAKAMQDQGRTKEYSISDSNEAYLAFAEEADLSFNIARGGLSGYLYNISGNGFDWNKKTTHESLKLDFTTQITKGYKLGQDVVEQIGNFIEQYVSAIAPVKTSSTHSNKRNFTKTITTVPKIDISGDGSSFVYQSKFHMVYLMIDRESYKTSTKVCFGNHEEEEFVFSMSYRVVEADIQDEMVRKNRDKLQKAFDMVSQGNMDDYAKKAGISNEAKANGA